MRRLKPFGVRLIGVRRSEWGDPLDGSAALLDERALWPQLQRWLPEADLVVRPRRLCKLRLPLDGVELA